MIHVRRWAGFFTCVRAWMPLVLELAITVASARMALLLFLDQGYFERYRNFYFWLLAHFPNEEWKWAILATVAASFKAVGILCMAFRQSELAQDAAFLLRGTGWMLSVVLWSTFGLSITIGDCWSLGSIACGVLAPLSFAALVMGPAMPAEAIHDRYEG